MEFVRLGERYTTDYVPDELVEGYNSLVWSERFFTHSEFELKSYDVYGLSELLPIDTLVSHLETREVMKVDTHSVEMEGEGADAKPEITIRGKAPTTIFEQRFVEAAYQKKRNLRKRYSAVGAASVLMFNAVDNASGHDVTRGDDDSDTEFTRNDYPWTEKDRIVNVAVTDSAAQDGELRWFKLQQGILYPQLVKILGNQDLGIRVLRPGYPNPGTTVFVKAFPIEERGNIDRTFVDDITQLRFDIYQGVNRKQAVQMSLLQGHLDSPEYVDSNVEYRTALEVMTGDAEIHDISRNLPAGQPDEATFTGWKRHVMEFDGGSPELPAEPQRPKEPRENATAAQRTQYRKDLDAFHDKWARWDNKRDRITDRFIEETEKEARQALRKQKMIHMFQAESSAYSPYVYKTHYDLGDTVMLHGDFGRSEEMVVAEYVRTEDAEGDRGIPGLVAPTP